MGYTLTQINAVLSKADRAIHILGSVAYNKKFAELDETYWYDRDIIFLYKYAVEWGKVNDRVGDARMDFIVERLEAMMEIYDYGSLTPIYSQVAQVTGINTVNFLTEETDPTVPAWVKLITQSDIDNWDESYTDRINSLTTIGSSGTATLINNILNIPNYGSALTSYVPYTGATTSVNLGANNITAQNYLSNGTGSVGGYMAFKQYSTSLSGIPGYTSIYAVTQNDLHIRYSQANGSQKIAQLSSAILGTTPRQYLFPDKDGTFALVGDIINLTFSSPLVNNSGVVSIPVATGSVDGYLSSTDWTTFNNKQSALNGTGFVKISGTTISYDNSTYYLASNPNAYIPLTALSFVAGSGAYNNTTGVITIPTNTSQLTNGANFITLVSLSGTAPIQYNNTTGAISITQSGSSSNGFLSSTDWNTFNSKQGAITLTTTGSSGAATLIGTTLNIPNYGSVIGNYVPYTGATNDVNLGVYTLSANSINIIGPGLGGLGGGYLGLKQNLSVLYGGGEYTSLTGEGKVYLSMYFSQDSIGTNYKLGRFDVSALTNNTQRTYSLPDASGTIALTSQLTSGTVTSVAASITGNSISISNSPIVTAGTLAFSFEGNATQYVRGDGALATLPTSGSGGGASVSYYLNGSINQGTIGGVTYYEMNRTPVIGTGTDFSISSNGYIASFLTDANDPALLNIPAGNFNFETYFEASSGGGTPTFYIELYKYDGTTFTLIASNSTNPKIINSGTSVEAYFTALAVPQTTLTLTDRLAIRIYVTTAGRTITLHTEDSNLCQVITTFTTGLTALNGLTAQVQYFATGTSGSDFNISSATATHTFNLPTASATNRGALSSADWTTFNNKQNALTLTTTGTSGAATLVGATLNIPQYQSVLTNPVTGTGTTNYLPKFTGTSTIGNSQIFDDGTYVGIGTITPTEKLQVNGNLLLGEIGVPADNDSYSIKLQGKGTTGIAQTGEIKIDASGTAATQGCFQMSTNGFIRFSAATGSFEFKNTAGSAVTLRNDTGGVTLQAFSTSAGITLRNNTSQTSGKLLSVVNASLNEPLTILANGNVGINNANPQRSLHINDVMRLDPRATAPSSPSAGDIYYSSADNTLKFYNGTTWRTIAGV